MFPFSRRRLRCSLVLRFVMPGSNQTKLPLSGKHHCNWYSEKDYWETRVLTPLKKRYRASFTPIVIYRNFGNAPSPLDRSCAYSKPFWSLPNFSSARYQPSEASAFFHCSDVALIDTLSLSKAWSDFKKLSLFFRHIFFSRLYFTQKIETEIKIKTEDEERLFSAFLLSPGSSSGQVWCEWTFPQK